MKKVQYERMLAKVRELIKTAAQPSDAMRSLIDSVPEGFSDEFRSEIRDLPFDRDVDQLERWLNNVLVKEPVPEEISAYWFGLFNPIIDGTPTSCLYVAGSNRFVEGGDRDWACRPAYFPERRYSKSQVLRSIYADGEKREESDGEYFCLWYSAVAVAELCRRLSDLMLGRAERRAVAVGFDSGDVLMLGNLTESGFEPVPYEPPSVPTVKTTASNALFYEIEDDPRGRWWLEHPVAASGDEEELPFGIGTWCERIDDDTPLKVTVDKEMGGTPVAFTFALTAPIVREDVGKLIRSFVGGEDIQLVPVKIPGQRAKFYLLNILRRVQCLDLQQSMYGLKDGRHGPVPDATPEDVRYVTRVVVDERRAGGYHLFRLDESTCPIIASSAMKAQLEAAAVTGIKFQPLASKKGN